MRAFIGGTGLEPINHAEGRGENYRRIMSNLGTFEPGTSEAELEGYLQQLDADPAALIRVLDTLVDTPREALARVAVPTLVIAGEQDNDRGSVEDLAATHFTALASTELKDQIARFLGDNAPS